MPNEIPEATIAFYGVTQTPEAVAAFYRIVVEWFQSLGHPPEKMAIRAPGHSGKYVPFARASARLEKDGFAGVRSMEITVLMPDAKIPVTDYLLNAMYSRETMFAVSPSDICPLSRPTMLSFAKRIVECVRPEYGIGYRRDHRLGPPMYAIGICQGEGLGPDEELRISRWSSASRARVWREGLLRDVYPWNFLAGPQLVKQVHGMPLDRWISQDPKRGALSPLSQGVFFWKVSEENIPSIRRELEQADVIFNWEKHIHLIS